MIKSIPFYFFTLGQALNNLGDVLFNFLIFWNIYLYTDSVTALALTTIIISLCGIFGNTISTSIIDHYPKKYILIISDISRGLILSILLFTNTFESQFLFYVLLIVIGLEAFAGGFFRPATNSLITFFVSSKELPKANAILSNSRQIMSLLGWISGPFLLTKFSSNGVLFVDIITFIVSAIILLGIGKRITGIIENSKGQSFLTKFKAGIQLYRQGPLKKFAYVYSVAIIAMAPLNFLGSAYAAHLGESSSLAYGLLQASLSVGMIVCGFLFTYLYNSKQPFKSFIGSLLCYGVACLILGLQSSLVFAIILWFFLGAALQTALLSLTNFIQSYTDQSIMGRAFTFMGIIQNTLTPLGVLILGFLGDFFNVNIVFASSGIMLILTFVINHFFKKRDAKKNYKEISFGE